jgi:uncharacterized membrane protein YraQ (UPF0718 family)
MLISNLVMVAMAAGLVVAALLKSPASLMLGLRGGGGFLLQTAPLLLAAFAIAGLVPVLVPREFIARWVGAESGFRGVVVGSLAGAATPLGPYVSYPIAAAILRAGAGIGPVVAFATGWGLLSVARMPWEFAFLGPKVALVRILLALPVPLLAGYLAHILFGRTAA